MRDRKRMVQSSREQEAVSALEMALAALERVHGERPSRENSLALTKVQEAVMWGARDVLVKDHGLGTYEPRLAQPVDTSAIRGESGTVVEPRETHRGPISRPEL